jgi:hypothetical protein
MIFDIRRAKNGCILKFIHSAEGTSEMEEVVFQEKYDDEVECFADFLRLLNEEYGPSTSRYSPKRIYITVESGDKYEEPKG